MEPPAPTPFALGSVLSRGLELYLRHGLSFSAISAITFLPLAVAYILLLEGVLPGTTAVTASLAIGTTVIESLVVLTLFQASWDSIHGRPVSIRKSVTVALGRFLPALGVSVLAGIFIALGLLAFVIPGLILMVHFWVAIPACLLERKGVLQSLKRSAELVRGNAWEVFALLLVLGIVQFVPEKILEKGLDKGAVSLEAYLFVPLVIGVFMTAITAAMTAIGYHALRGEKEPEEIEKIASVFD